MHEIQVMTINTEHGHSGSARSRPSAGFSPADIPVDSASSRTVTLPYPETGAAAAAAGSGAGTQTGPGSSLPNSKPSHKPSHKNVLLQLPLRNRLSYKQARNAAVVALILGLLLGALQIFADLMQLQRNTDVLVKQLLGALKLPAAEAAYSFDQELAKRVLDGLVLYGPIQAGEIRDDYGTPLAFRDRPLSQGNLRWLAQRLVERAEYMEPLIVDRYGQRAVGELHVIVDPTAVAADFFRRSLLTLTVGLSWTAAMAGLLGVMFYLSITLPLLTMARQLARVDPLRPADGLLEKPRHHEDDELGLITRIINGLLRQSGHNLEQHQQAEARVIEREARLRDIMENVADGIVTMDQQYRVESMNRAALDLFACAAEDVMGRPLADFVVEGEDWRRVLVALVRCLDQASAKDRGDDDRQELNARRLDGTVVPVAFGISRMRHGDTVTFICVVQDVTHRRQAEAALRTSEERLKLAVTATRSGVWDHDLVTGQYFWSAEFTRMLGYGENELPARRDTWESLVHPDDLPWCQTLAERYLKGEVPEYQPVYRMRRKDGSWVWIEEKAYAVRDARGTAVRFTGTLADVTERKRYEEQLMYMATHDPLTGLPNRTLLQDRLSHALNMAKRKNTAVGVLHLDLDRFKLINETLGHPVGDQLLRAVSETLSQSMRPSETVGRLGGDEFLIIAEDLLEPQDAARVADTVLRALARLYTIDGNALFVTPSIGISVFTGSDTDMPTLLRHADTAMHSAKTDGGNTYRYFIPEMNEEAVARLALEHSLRRAVELGQFELFYQPKVDLATLKLVGLEGLIRWRHPEEGYISPARFIPMAEETGLIVPIGEWVMKTALKQVRAWQERGIPPLPIAVNVSLRQLITGNPAALVGNLLQEAGVSPDLLEIEITESVMMDSPDVIIAALRELRGLGLRIAMDDFGTGYSSLSYLRQLPITALKVDRSFIDGVTDNPDDAAIAATIIAMGRQLGLKVVAEGIESVEQIVFLQRHRCDEMQGFYISRPLPTDQLEARFLRHGTWVSADITPSS